MTMIEPRKSKGEEMPRTCRKEEGNNIRFGGSINTLDDIQDELTFDERAAFIRERCKAERTQLGEQKKRPRKTHLCDKRFNASPTA